MIKKSLLLFVALFSILLGYGCTNVQDEYYEVHIIEGETDFYYVDVSEGTELLGQNVFENVDTFSIYLYMPEEGETFDYTQYFSFLGDCFVYRHIETGKYYIAKEDDMAPKVYQFHIDKEAFDAGE